MVSKKYWEKRINEFLALVRKEKKTREISLLGFSFKIIPDVFSPIYSSDTAWFAEKISSKVKGTKFLEIGAGTGIIACLASLNGASHVTATDINLKAVENILLNVRQHALEISVKEGNLFDPLDEKDLFDVIFWNHPFYCADKHSFQKDMLSASVYDLEYQALSEFFNKSHPHLLKGGRLILGSSNVAKINLIKKIATKAGYKIFSLEKTLVPIYKESSVKMDLRIYTFIRI